MQIWKFIQNIVNNNKTQYKQAHLTTILQSTMLFEGVNLKSMTFEVNDFWSQWLLVNTTTYVVKLIN